MSNNENHTVTGRDLYQSFKVYSYDEPLDKTALFQVLTRTKEHYISRKDSLGVSQEIKKAFTSNLKEYLSGFVFDLWYLSGKTDDDEDESNVEEHKIFISSADNVLIIFGSFTNEKIIRVIQSLIYGKKSEHHFRPSEYNVKQIIEFINKMIDNLDDDEVIVDDPRFSFFKELYREKRYSNFAGDFDKCVTKTKDYHKSLNKCSDCRPIFNITTLKILNLEMLTIPRQLRINNTPLGIWGVGLSLSYKVWLNFFFKYCYILFKKG